jgi:hypothetical protein
MTERPVRKLILLGHIEHQELKMTVRKDRKSNKFIMWAKVAAPVVGRYLITLIGGAVMVGLSELVKLIVERHF